MRVSEKNDRAIQDWIDVMRKDHIAWHARIEETYKALVQFDARLRNLEQTLVSLQASKLGTGPTA